MRSGWEWESALIDRQAELDAIDHLLRTVLTGSGGLVCIEGAPGLGKSRLLHEAAVRAEGRGLSVLDGRSREVEQSYPFVVALQLFEGFLARCPPGEAERLLEGAAGLAAPLVAPGLSASTRSSGFPVALS